MKEDFSDEDGIRAAELEAESDVSLPIQGQGLSGDILYSSMSALTGKEKVKVLLAQALFGNPGIILLDKLTNHLDVKAIDRLKDFLMEYEGTVIVVSHDHKFIQTVANRIMEFSPEGTQTDRLCTYDESIGEA